MEINNSILKNDYEEIILKYNNISKEKNSYIEQSEKLINENNNKENQ